MCRLADLTARREEGCAVWAGAVGGGAGSPLPPGACFLLQMEEGDHHLGEKQAVCCVYTEKGGPCNEHGC